MLERQVAREIYKYLTETLGLRVFRADPGGRTWRTRPNARGMPDFYGILPGGRWWAIEVKSPDAKPRKDQSAQREILAFLRERGALVIVATSVADVHAVFARVFCRPTLGEGPKP